jgi:hypothetical protein
MIPIADPCSMADHLNKKIPDEKLLCPTVFSLLLSGSGPEKNGL